jgi:hypothetical protein
MLDGVNDGRKPLHMLCGRAGLTQDLFVGRQSVLSFHLAGNAPGFPYFNTACPRGATARLVDICGCPCIPIFTIGPLRGFSASGVTSVWTCSCLLRPRTVATPPPTTTPPAKIAARRSEELGIAVRSEDT